MMMLIQQSLYFFSSPFLVFDKRFQTIWPWPNQVQLANQIRKTVARTLMLSFMWKCRFLSNVPFEEVIIELVIVQIMVVIDEVNSCQLSLNIHKMHWFQFQARSFFFGLSHKYLSESASVFLSFAQSGVLSLLFE